MTDLAVRFEDDELVSELLALADWQLARPRADGLPLLDLGQATCVWVDCMQFQGPFPPAWPRSRENGSTTTRPCGSCSVTTGCFAIRPASIATCTT